MIKSTAVSFLVVAASAALVSPSSAGGLLGGAVSNVGGAVGSAVGAGAGAAAGLAGGGGGAGSGSGLLGATIGSNGLTSGYSSSGSASGNAGIMGNREGVGGGRLWGTFEETTRETKQALQGTASRGVPQRAVGVTTVGTGFGGADTSIANSRSVEKDNSGGIARRIDELASGVRLGRQVRVDTQPASANGSGRVSGEASASRGKAKTSGSSEVSAGASTRR